MITSEGSPAPTSTRVSSLAYIGRLAFILQLVLGPLMWSASAVISAQETWTVLPTIPTSEDTSTTVQSKAWFHGHTWWAVLPSSTPSSGTWLYRLEANNTWTQVLRLSSMKGRSDAKAKGNLTHVLIVGSNAQVVTIEYVPAQQTYRLWPENPAPVSIFVGETGSLEVDSTGRLWIGTDHFNWVYVYYSDYPYTTFSDPIILTDQTNLGDVNQIVSFPNNTIGVFWGNGLLEHFGFRIHIDGTDPTVWLADEAPGAAYAGLEMADDHINLAVSRNGTLYAALKAKHPSTTVPPVYMMVRRPNSSGTGGTWDSPLYPIDAITPGESESGSGRRPLVVVNDDTETIRVFYHDSGGRIYFRESDAENIAFGPRNQVLDGGFEYVTSTKEPWSGRLVVLATNNGTGGILIATDPALVGQWTMDEGSGSIAKDSSGWGNHANIFGSPSWSPSPKGRALDFDGSTDYAVVSDQWALDPTTGLTLAAWIKPQAQGSLDIISRAAAGSVDGYALSLTPSTASTNPRTVVMQLNEASSGNTYRVNSTTQYPTNGSTWMHVTATYDGTTMRMYVNGDLERSELGPPSIAANLINVGIGAQSDGTRKFRGQLDDVRIYRRALSATEIGELSRVPFGDLSITKTDGLTTILSGQSLTYSIQVRNFGPDAVRGVVSDSLPSRLTAATWTCSSSGGASCAPNGTGGITDTADLPAGGVVTYSLAATVTAGASATLSNTATVSATNGIDPQPDNNSATDTTSIQQPPAPQIITQPSNVTVTAPQPATFTVEASGPAPLSYQWRRNGSNIAGATSASYVRTPTAVSDTGSTYSVVVSNGGGSVTSTAATLTVSPAPVPPSITTQPSSTMAFEPNAATFSVVATGTSPLSYQWRRNGAPIPGATGTSYTVNPTSGADNGASFSVVVSNVAGSVTSSAATLSVFGPGSGTVTLLEAHFDSDANDFTYVDDAFRGTSQPGYANGAYISSGGFTTGALQVGVGGINSQNILNMSGGWRRSFTIGSAVPLALVFRHRLTELPTYESDEFSQTLVTLDGVLRGVAPNDYIAQVVGGGPTTTGWQLIQIDLGTVAAGTHVLTLGAYNNKKSYHDESAEVLIDDVLLLANNGPSGPPNITTHPASLTVTAPTSATFTVGATGSAPLSYQWRRNGSAISGATTQSYTLASTSMSDNNATFDCVVTNGSGSATSSSATLTVNAASTPPSITTQPANATVTAPAAATFSVVAAGTAPLSYQWRRNGAPIGGATGSSYTLSPTALSDNGAVFTVFISNGAGSITSTPATLTVNSGSVAPSITTQPSAQFVTAPAGATFSVVATGTAPLSYQWRRGGTPIAGATSSSYSLTPTQLSDNGASFDVVVSNSMGSVTSSSALLTVSSGGGGGGSTLIEAHFDADANGFTYADDLFRGTAMPNYASGAYIASGGFTGGGLRVQVAGVNSQNISNMSGGWTRSFTLPSAAPVTLTFRQRLTEQPTYESDEFTEMLVSVDGVLRGVAPNDYVAQVVGGGTTTTGWQLVELDLGTLAAGTHTLALGAYGNKKTALDEFAEVLIDDVLVVQGGGSSATPPSITTSPASLTVNEPTQATFSVVAGGTAPLSYQWRRNGSNIVGATGSSYTLSPTSSADNGASFDVVVSNSAGNATSAAAMLTVNVAPVITTQPANMTVTQPASAMFSVVATGTAPLSYQWRRAGANIPGATGSSYVLSSTTLSDNGAAFDVIVSNMAGIVTSATATLTVNAGAVAPGITTQPANQTVTAPGQATFSVVATGTGPLSYQWRRGGADIPGANGSSYVLASTTLADNLASFDVVVSNSAGSVTSSAATLTVLSGGGGPTLIDAHFDSGTDGFVYADDLFRGSLQPNYANGTTLPAGGFSGSGGLQVLMGGINSQNIQKMSGGWQRGFSLADAATVTLTFRYRLTGNNVRSNRFGQVLVGVNGVLRGVPPNDYVAQVLGGLGGVTSTTDWQQVQINLGPLPAGTHVLSLGGYMNGKSNSNETVEVIIDDVIVTQ